MRRGGRAPWARPRRSVPMPAASSSAARRRIFSPIEEVISGADLARVTSAFVREAASRARRANKHPPPHPSPTTGEGAACGWVCELIMRVLVTRPEADARRTAATLSALGYEARIAPLLRIKAIPAADLGSPPWQAVLMTSANAAHAIARHRRFAELRSLPVLAVGDRTGEAARAAGFADVSSAGGHAGDLAGFAADRFVKGTPLLYLAGSDQARDLAADLAPRGLAVRTDEIYRAHAAQQFPPEVLAGLGAGDLDGVLHFSRRSAEIFLQCAERAGLLAAALRPLPFCISAPAAEPLARAGARAIRIATQPNEDALVALVGSP